MEKNQPARCTTATYQNYGDPIGVEFDVQRIPDLGQRDAVSVTAYRQVGWERHRLMDFGFRDGKLAHKRVLGASAQEGPWLEQLATQLD